MVTLEFFDLENSGDGDTIFKTNVQRLLTTCICVLMQETTGEVLGLKNRFMEEEKTNRRRKLEIASPS